jgi:hypothetical protein
VPPPQPGEPYGRPVDPDPTGGFYQPIRILVGTGDVASIATLRIACGLVGASPDNVLDFQKNYVRNKNPEIASLTVPMQVARGSTAPLAIAWKETEAYIAYDPSQQKNLPRRESMRVSWFVTDGVLASDRTGRASDDPATDSSVDYTASENPGMVHGWAVLRDDRGGVAWQSFTLEVP